MRRRMVWLSVLALLLMAGMGGRVFHLTVMKNEEYTRIARNQRALTLELGDPRGRILDRNGRPLTDPQPGWGVAAFPPLIADERTAEGVARALAPALGRPWAELLPFLAGQQEVGGRQVDNLRTWMTRDVTAAVAADIQAMGLPGIAVGPVAERYGPGAVAHHLVGYATPAGEGKQGLEQVYDSDLRGTAVPSLSAYLDGRGRAMAGLGIQ
ncbi:MAG TPA: hypothetical protein VD902_03830, partial [Symbiobacteriaceae bacterium]|nr:hypothetical protein [Symbiobacteriaceae bacterium]